MALKADTGAAKRGLLLLFLKFCSTLTFRQPRLEAKGWGTLPGLGLPPREGISLQQQSSWSYRIFHVGRDSQGSPSPSPGPAQSWVKPTMLPAHKPPSFKINTELFK